MSAIPHGPSARFLVENVHTVDELELTGNCLKRSRPILLFDKEFDDIIHYKLLIRKCFLQIFGTPHNHATSKLCFD